MKVYTFISSRRIMACTNVFTEFLLLPKLHKFPCFVLSLCVCVFVSTFDPAYFIIRPWATE
jgi:hypothetical protein